CARLSDTGWGNYIRHW
nr:immunoglobulin heavy chain junction region [Macaca mulatta]MOW99206.1 immunoglobulin heavy chain junction region [Macaca mulatta]MOW99423.1 immunoglobulin heavy chain junction region [Macaca mulatta]MOW99798.1 immunoglobulin heavy chain junction region [Macaca mulatta]MOX00440.1 immunoglobulin heavy chain junction region [Macaca mulatta]